MSQARSMIVNPGLLTKAAQLHYSGLKAGAEVECPEDGLWLIRQTFDSREEKWLAGMLGGYFPSLPRVLSVQSCRSELQVCLGSAPGEALREYSERVGPMPVGVACVLVWRLATELEALETWMPEALRHVDPLSCQAGLWQQDFLHLFIDRFEPPYESQKPADLASRLLRVCSILISGQAIPDIDRNIAARVPTAFLSPLRQLEHTGSAGLTLQQLKGLMLMTTSAVTRGLRGSNLMALLIVGESWHPVQMNPLTALVPLERRAGSRTNLTAVRLSRLLAHRNRLTGSEVELLMQRLRDHADGAEDDGMILDPQYIQLQLPYFRDGQNDLKILDVRLDSLPDFGVSVQSSQGCLMRARSPVAVREGSAPDLPFTDLRGLVDEQYGRLLQTLQDGTFSLSGYDMTSSPEKDLPGLFSCALPLPALDKRALASLKTAIGESLAPSKPPVPAAAIPVAVEIPAYAPSSLFNSPNKLMKMILITAGSGGTGKSTVARLIYELANFENRDDVAMFDCDALGNRDFQKISPEKIESMPIDNVDTMRCLVETAMERKLVLADLPASCQDVLARDLNPEIIQSLRVDEGLHWMPIHILTAKAAAVPAIKQWREAVFGDSPSVLIVSMKDGPVTADMLDEVARPQDIVLKMPLLDQSLASALDSSNATWLDILDGKVTEGHRMFSNPLVKRQLRFKRKECEDALFPLLRLILNDQQTDS